MLRCLFDFFFFFWILFNLIILCFVVLLFPCARLKNQKKPVVTAVDKKVPNGILEEQGNILSTVDFKSDRLTALTCHCLYVCIYI